MGGTVKPGTEARCYGSRMGKWTDPVGNRVTVAENIDGKNFVVNCATYPGGATRSCLVSGRVNVALTDDGTGSLRVSYCAGHKK